MNLTYVLVGLLALRAEALPRLSIHIQNVESKKGGLTLSLSKEGEKIFCRTGDVPEHEIRTYGFSWTEAPFPNESSLESGCKKVIIWSNRRQCYHYGRIPKIDDLIRKCSNI